MESSSPLSCHFCGMEVMPAGDKEGSGQMGTCTRVPSCVKNSEGHQRIQNRHSKAIIEMDLMMAGSPCAEMERGFEEYESDS